LYQYFLDAKKQEELVFYMDAIRNEKYYSRQSELVAVLWQSSLDSSEHFNELIEIALEGDYMTIIEVGTVIDSYDHAFEEDLVLDAQFRLEEAIEEEDDEDRKKLLVNLKQIISELHLING
jgi:hypothetical protein